MPEFVNSGDVNFEALNEHLLSHSFVEGFAPTQSDNEVASLLLTSVNAKYTNIRRWLSTILSFSSSQRSSWPAVKKATTTTSASSSINTTEEKKETKKANKADDDGFDFDDDDDDEEAAATLIAKKKAEAEAKKKAETKTGPVAKSSIVFDVKPEDDETNLDTVEKAMREIVMDGLLWGVAQKVPVAYGIFKLRVMTTVVDDLVSTDELEERLAALPGVQSVDIHAFNKI